MRQQILNLFTTPRDMSWEDILLNIVLAAVLGFFIFLSYAISHRGTIYSSAVTFAVILLLGCIKSDNRMLLIIRAHRSKQEPIKAQVYKLFRAKATLRVENTTEDTVELIYEITQKLLRRAEQTTPDIPGSIYSLGSIDYVNLVMQNDEVSN